MIEQRQHLPVLQDGYGQPVGLDGLRKRGELVSKLLVEYDAKQGEVDHSGILERIEASLERIEKAIKRDGGELSQ